MNEEIKIADLARLWNVSVNTVWARIKKEGLLTSKRLDNNKEITFVSVPEEILKKYAVNNVINHTNNVDNEELLTSNNPDNGINNPQTVDIIERIMEYSKGVNEQLITINNNYNEELKTINNELMMYKSQMPLLEDKASREGLYLKEINELKEVNNKVNKRNEALKSWLITVIILMVLALSTLSVFLILAIKKPPEIRTVEVEKIIEKTVEKPVIKYVRR
jgi:hypothetical protein